MTFQEYVQQRCDGPGPCRNFTSNQSMWFPFCSNECEQRSQIDAGRGGSGLNPRVIETVRQLDLETARPWEPRRFDVGTVEDRLAYQFEHNPGVRFPRGALLEYARSSLRQRVNERNIMDAIRELRRGGWPIISSSGEEGYWLSWDPADLDQLEQTLRGRSLDMLRTLSAVRRARARVGRIPILDDMIESMEKGEL